MFRDWPAQGRRHAGRGRDERAGYVGDVDEIPRDAPRHQGGQGSGARLFHQGRDQTIRFLVRAVHGIQAQVDHGHRLDASVEPEQIGVAEFRDRVMAVGFRFVGLGRPGGVEAVFRGGPGVHVGVHAALLERFQQREGGQEVGAVDEVGVLLVGIGAVGGQVEHGPRPARIHQVTHGFPVIQIAEQELGGRNPSPGQPPAGIEAVDHGEDVLPQGPQGLEQVEAHESAGAQDQDGSGQIAGLDPAFPVQFEKIHRPHARSSLQRRKLWGLYHSYRSRH